MKFFDGIASLALKLGLKQEQTKYTANSMLTEKRDELEALWRENWIANKICIKRPEDMTRAWRDVFSNDLDSEQLDAFTKYERRIKLRETLTKALQWSSLYGSVGLLIVTDATNLNTPLRPTEKLKRLIILPKWKISTTGERETNITDANFGKYKAYSISGDDKPLIVHHSRLLIMNANDAPLSDSSIWGISDLEKIIDALKRFDIASANVGDLIFESKIDIFKIDGLSDKIASGFENEVANVIGAVQAIKSSTNSLLLDKENEYDRKELSFGGLKDLITEFRNAVAGAADMPVTILFGQSVSGLASGDEDIQNYHESIHRLQEARLRPVLEVIDTLICGELFGGQPEDWWFEFLPLTVVKQEQQINMLNTFATATNTLIQNGIVTEQQVANELRESGLFANISADDIEDMNNADELARDFEEPKDESEEVQNAESKQENGALV